MPSKSICAECKEVNGKTCCEVYVGEVPTMPLSLPEVQRIKKATGMAPSDFMVVEQVDPFDVSGQIMQSPVFKALLVGDTRVRLKTVQSETDKSIERCVFLGDKGCTLDKSVRPHGCRLFPFTYNAQLAKSQGGRGGLVRIQCGETCLAMEEASRDDTQLAASLGMRVSDLINIGQSREVDATQHASLMKKE